GQGDVAGARAAYQQAIDSGHADAAPLAACSLGRLLDNQGDLAGAHAAYQQAIDSGHRQAGPRAAGYFGALLARQGDVTGARAAYQLAIDSAEPDVAPWAASNLGDLLAEQGDVAGARAAYQLAIDSGHHDAAPLAASGLGDLLGGQGDVAGARAAYQQAIDSGHADWAPWAALDLGAFLQEQGDLAGARAAFRQAIDSGHHDAAALAAGNLAQLPDEPPGHGTGHSPDSPDSPDSPIGMSNRDRVSSGLELLAAGLGPFVQAVASPSGRDWAEMLAARDSARFGGKHRYSLSNPRFLLRVLTEEFGAFKAQLSQVERGFASELRETGNRWAHHEPMSADDTYRALDTMERLLTAVGAAEQASQVREIRSGLLTPPGR
ncbi:MAG TPA: Swt1 family HEPN domain-containing protein, partial [Streptosporangiaceae bacterium]